jgi:hypothetical protein
MAQRGGVIVTKKNRLLATCDRTIVALTKPIGVGRGQAKKAAGADQILALLAG